jgi:serine/threonine protein kinase
MGVVYHGRDVLLDREVAIKVLLPEMSRDEGFLKRFQHEVRISAKLEHPNIIPIYSVAQAGKIYYFVMKYIEGTSLSNIIAKGMENREISRVVNRVAEALNYAHGKGVIHRDIKPDNIMISSAGEVFIMDFGVARAIHVPRLTNRGDNIGTPKYMSPEQIQGKELDGRSDLYSLGIVIYEMLMGEPPFMGDTTALMYKHVNEPVDFEKLNQIGVPQYWIEILQKCLAKNSRERFKRASRLASMLETEDKRKKKVQTENEVERYAKTTTLLQLQKGPKIAEKNDLLHVIWITGSAALLVLLSLLMGYNNIGISGLDGETSGLLVGTVLMILTGAAVFLRSIRNFQDRELTLFWFGFSIPFCIATTIFFEDREITWGVVPGVSLGLLLSTFFVQVSGFILILFRRDKIEGNEIAVFWMGLFLCFLMQFILYGHQLIGAFLLLGSGIFLILMRRSKLQGLELPIYWFGCIIGIYLALNSLVPGMASILISAGLGLISGFFLLKWKSRRLARP